MANNELVVLPNKDLWRGHVRKPKSEDNVAQVEETRPFAKLDEVMASIMKVSAGAKELSCIYCGLQFETAGMRDHLKKNHASAVEPPSDAQLIEAAKLIDKA
jgi:hypothetical protein